MNEIRKDVTQYLTFEDVRLRLRALEPVEECVSELGERPELLLGVDDEGVAGNHAVLVAVHHSYEPRGRMILYITYCDLNQFLISKEA